MKHTLLSLVLLALGACGPELAAPSAADTLSKNEAALVAPVSGSIPRGMPARLLVGLFEDTGQTWMKDSAVPWNVRYRYFVKGWMDNWGWGPTNGQWGLQYLRECDAQGFLPAVQYYQMNGEPGGGEEQFLAKAQNTATMRGYFSASRCSCSGPASSESRCWCSWRQTASGCCRSRRRATPARTRRWRPRGCRS
jgi:hypothetical protein